MVPRGRSCEFTRQGACRAAMPGIPSGAQRGRWARKTALRVAFPASSVRRARLTMRSIAECAHVLVEPAGAAALAGAWERRDAIRGKRVLLLLTGANIPRDVLLDAMNGEPLFTLEEAAAAGG